MAAIVGETSNLSGDYADNYMKRAVNKVNEAFGKDFAHRHPKLVAAFMQTAALAMLTVVVENAGQTVAEALDNLHEPLRSDHPLQGQTFSGLESALQDIAEALAQKENAMTDRRRTSNIRNPEIFHRYFK